MKYFFVGVGYIEKPILVFSTRAGWALISTITVNTMITYAMGNKIIFLRHEVHLKKFQNHDPTIYQ